uniref:Uncharacterized protein n=1 Tax=Mucochytrium quahogii TaxID=96639 RepID=A0A7S2WDB5_9STRA|mmetsp:Transcript_22307/g.35664  ORF Transcript_22307/g.35664 Transcript_22307/m.35664 type:complete len:807 (+) Transcript_22307:244-2664(+)|eukprot:CAMPEP_0203752436 /NCGR_PEP_ID=MMETSP0098-20131031/6370_1 /ASSEMBLY_ACC=CAM_ASM_000208 /TAXON_ID=96639 /ORGANISM=" , Strain NY0313808BC1" /LENGTH=806 /DNA_ID=CAMNT_0050642611 /DNA_START=201 /DNA_END=2621 /DNA_ORIENTATION=+
MPGKTMNEQFEVQVKGLGRRVGISEEMIDTLLQSRREDELAQGARSPGDSSTASDLSISLKSSLFGEDESQTMSVDFGTASGIRNPAFQNAGLDSGFYEQLDAVRHEKKLLEVDFEREVQRAQRQLQETHKHYKRENDSLKRRVAELEKHVPDLKRRLEVSRTDFYDVQCPASMYDQLKKMDEDQLSLKELVWVKVFELGASQRAQIAALTLELQQARNELADKAARVLELEGGEDTLKKKYENNISELETELGQANGSAASFKKKYLDTLKRVDEFQEQSQLYGVLRARCDELEHERSVAREQLNHALEQARISERTLSEKSEEFQSTLQQLELVKVDKSYLKRELEDSKRETLRLEQALEREREKSNTLEDRRDRAREQLHEVRENAKSDYEQRLAKQIETLKEDNRRQLAELKQAQLAISEREVRTLKAAREEALNEVEHTRSLAQRLEHELEDAKLELGSKDAMHQIAITEVRSNLNMRVFETQTMATTLEEKSCTIRKLELENEMLTSKLEILKNEFTQLETSTSKLAVELNSKIISQEEKLNVYETLELELDSAIVDHAQHSLETGPAVDPTIRIFPGGDNKESMIPIAAQRRAKHSILLAQKLVKTERELGSCRAECREFQSTINLLKKRLEHAESLASSSSQPQEYLIGKLNQKDEQLEKAQARIELLEDKLQEAEKTLKHAFETRTQLHKDFEHVLEERKTLERAMKEHDLALGSSTISVDSIPPPPPPPPEGVSPAQSPAQVHFHQSDPIILEVDSPEVGVLNTSVASVESATFILHEQDEQGIPLPKWYHKMRQK